LGATAVGGDGIASIDLVCGAISAVSSSAKKTIPSASATSTPPTPKSMYRINRTVQLPILLVFNCYNRNGKTDSVQ
jgi:hypothetical protein